MTSEQNERMTDAKLRSYIDDFDPDDWEWYDDLDYKDRLALAKTNERSLRDMATDLLETRTDLAAERERAEKAEAGLNKWESREAAVCPEGYRFEEVIGQLRVDIAIAYERAEKAESEASRYESLHIRCSEAYVTVRNQLALAEQQRDAAVSGLEKIASRSVQPKRHNPHQDMAYQLDGYEAIARDTLARIRELGEREQGEGERGGSDER